MYIDVFKLKIGQKLISNYHNNWYKGDQENAGRYLKLNKNYTIKLFYIDIWTTFY